MAIQTALLASTLLASIAAELVASWPHVPNLVWIYLCARGLSIIGLAAFWLEGRIRLTPWTFLLFLVSIYFLWLFTALCGVPGPDQILCLQTVEEAP